MRMNQSPVVRRVHEESLGQVVVFAVGEARGVDPADLDDRLYDVIDPDALDNLFTGGGGTLEFTFAGCQVTVHGGERVVVVPTSVEAGAEPVATVND